MTGTDASIPELQTFAKNARERSDAVTGVVTDAEAVHLGHNVMGVVGASFVGDAGASLAKIVGDMRKSATALAGDADAAWAAATDYESTEQSNTDTFTGMDTQ